MLGNRTTKLDEILTPRQIAKEFHWFDARYVGRHYETVGIGKVCGIGKVTKAKIIKAMEARRGDDKGRAVPDQGRS